MKNLDIEKIDHIGIAVEDLEEAISLYKILMNAEPSHREIVSSQKVETAFFNIGESNIELLAATSDDSPIAKFISKKGRGGIHHICIEVDDIHKKLEDLKKQGIDLIDSKPKKGAHNCLVAFIHPKAMGGVLIELSQKIK